VNLNFSSCKLQDQTLADIQNFTNLVTLRFEWCSNLKDPGLRYLTAMTRLSTLDLSFCYEISDEGLPCLAIPSLTWLSLRRCDQITDYGISHLLPKLTRLLHLDLCSCEKLTDTGVWCIEGSVGTRIETLLLDYCENITDRGVQTIASMNSLTVLDLSNCPKITSNAFLCLTELKNLKVLELFGSKCPKATATILRMEAEKRMKNNVNNVPLEIRGA